MAKGTSKSFSTLSTRQITHTHLHDEATIDIRYERLNKLGEGSFGTVYCVKSRENNFFYAMKTIQKKHGSKSKALFLDNEVKLLTEVNHPNLIQLHEVLESSQNLYLIIELCEGGELAGYVKKNGPLPEETIKQIMSKLINALHYLHKMDIVHRDLKLENILLKKIPKSKFDEFDIRITDFGLSSKKSITSTDSLFHGFCGTLLYMAPEILENRDYSALCDVWAMGIIMYYLICGRHPFVADDQRRLLELIRSQKLRFDSEKFRYLSKEGLEFLQGMLMYDTIHRRTMGELTIHPWLTGESDRGPATDIITMMKEFQAENDKKQQSIQDDSLTTATNTVEVSDNLLSPRAMRLESMSTTESKTNRQDKFSETQSIDDLTRTNMHSAKISPMLQRRAIQERHLRSNSIITDSTRTPRRSLHGTVESTAMNNIKARQNSTIRDSTNSNIARPTAIAAMSPASSSPSLLNKNRSIRTRLGRSQSQSIFPISSKYPTQVQQKSLVNGTDDHSFTTVSNTHDPTKQPTSTATALMMINKQYPDTTNNPKSMTFYEKRQINYV